MGNVQTGATGVEKIEIEKVKREGWLKLTKIKIITDYDVCCDEVKSFDDYQNFYILRDGGKYYHWLKNPTDDKDLTKLSFLGGIIPITLHSSQDFKFEATFKVVFGDIEKATIEVNKKDKDNPQKYQFNSITINSKCKDDEFTETFTATNKPYKDTIQFFEKFDLRFETTDCKSFLSKATFRLYLTWKEPLWNKFVDTGNPETTMKIKCSENGNKKSILETLLWLGCKDCGNIGNSETDKEKNEEKILDKIFERFNTKKVKRSREGNYKIRNWDGVNNNNGQGIAEGMGYWRGISAVNAQDSLTPTSRDYSSFYDPIDGHIKRNLRVVAFQYGEFRCGEWAEFLIYILLCQQIELTQFMIFSGVGYDRSYYTSDKMIKRATTSPFDILEYYYANLEFYVKDNGWTFNDPAEPRLSISTTNRAQGNTNPLHKFSDHVFVLRVNGNKKSWYDPSYGIKSVSEFSANETLLSDYSSSALQRMGYLEFISTRSYKTIAANINQHIVLATITGNKTFVNSYSDYNFKSNGIVAIIDSSGNSIKRF